MMKSAPRVKNPYVLGSLFYSFFWGTYGVFEPFINPYFQKIGLSGAQIGVLLSLPPLVAVVIAPLVSSLADRKGWRAPILVGLSLVVGLLYFFYQYPRSFQGIFIFTLLIALVRGPTQPLADSLILRMASKYQIDFGRMRLWGSFFYASFAALCGFLWEWLDISWMFPAAMLGFFLVALVASRMEENPAVTEKVKAPWGLILRNPTLLMLYISAFLAGATVNAFYFTGMLMVHLGGGERMVGILLGVTAMAEVPVMRNSGFLMRRFGGMNTCMMGFGLYAAAFTLGSLATAPWILLVAGALHGAGFGLVLVSVLIIFDQHTPDNWTSSVQSLVSAGMMGASPFLTAFLYGWIYDLWPAGVYAFSLLLALLAMITLIVAIRFEKRSIMKSQRELPPAEAGVGEPEQEESR